MKEELKAKKTLCALVTLATAIGMSIAVSAGGITVKEITPSMTVG